MPGGRSLAVNEDGLSEAVTWNWNGILSFAVKTERELITGVRDSFNIVTVIGVDVLTAISLSVAFAVMTYPPLAEEVHETE